VPGRRGSPDSAIVSRATGIGTTSPRTLRGGGPMKADHDVATEPSVGEPLSTSFAYQRFDRVRLGRFRPHVVVLAAMGRRVCHDGTGGDPVFAALWRRAAAWLVDVLMFAGATLGVVAATGIRRPLALAWRVVWSGPTSITPAVLHQLVGAGIVVSLGVLLGGFVLWVVYRVVCTGYWGRTAGKCLFGIQVVRAEEPTAAPGLRRGFAAPRLRTAPVPHGRP
jgi:hypothetical protein